MTEGKDKFPPPLEDSIPVEVFKSEVRAWAERIGVEPQSIIVRPMKRKWASCSSKGNLTFDTDLLRQPAEFRRKAIVHELLHLKVPNHGKLFRSLENTYLNDQQYQMDK
ncbi:MAG TPA: M48 family metallopeptidase [Anaerolineales bacterium]|nr:M48 family metallopeptidase [Anaerolineales bacterium]